MTPHPSPDAAAMAESGSGGLPVVVVPGEADEQAATLLGRSLGAAGFAALAKARPAMPTDRALILLDLGACSFASPAIVRRELVEHLVDYLAGLGWADIALASSADSSSTWLENRSVPILADFAGYTYETGNGTPYDVIDLSDGFDAAHGGDLAPGWNEAALRIVFAKCMTDQHDGFALCANTLLCALPLVDKDYYYRLRSNPADVLAALLAQAPPHFSLIDACGAFHGSGGRDAPEPLATHALIAGTDLLAVDCAGAACMGADPLDSPLLAGLVGARGRPPLPGPTGATYRFDGFRLPDPLLVDSVRRRDRSPVLARLVAPWLKQVDTALFPFKNPVDARLNAQLSHLARRPDGEPASKALFVSVNRLAAAAAGMVEAGRVTVDKDQVARRVAPVSPQALACTEADYQRMQAELDELERLLPTRTGQEAALRWRPYDGAIVFEYQRTFAVPFEQFVASVDISRTIQFMSDYVGGGVQPLVRDDAGRPLRQAERNFYLPQPNYLAWYGGREIDVSKIESVQYEARRQRMYWKTVVSENDSAEYDDGIVTFEARGDATCVTIFGRQLFTLPPFWQAVNLDLYPGLKARLVEHAYTSFFSRTFANLDALVEGRSIAIGRPWHAPACAQDSAPRPVEAIVSTFSALAGSLAPVVENLAARAARPAAALRFTDEAGFTHCRAPAATASGPAPVAAWLHEFWQGYGEAFLRDAAAGQWLRGVPAP